MRGLAILVVVIGLGLPIYIAIVKKRAQASLDQLLAERFSPCPSPVAEVAVPRSGKIRVHSAYTDKMGSGFVLLLGNLTWQFSKRGAYVRVAGLFNPKGDNSWLERVRRQSGVMVAIETEGGALFFWKGSPSWSGLPSKKTILSRLKALQ